MEPLLVADSCLRLSARNVHAHLPLLDACRLSSEVAEVVQLRATNSAPANDDDCCDHGAMRRENALDANSAGDFANREGLADSATAAGEANAFERLEALFVTFFDANIDANSVTGAEWRQIAAEPLFLGFNKWMHKYTRGGRSQPGTRSCLG